MGKKFITQKNLAHKLGVSLAVVNNWIQRELIAVKLDNVTGIRLVEDVAEKPTKTYKKNS